MRGLMRRNRLIVWRVNLAAIPRRRGRAVPKNLAIKDPSLEEIANAMRRLGLEPETHPEKRYPSLWFDESVNGYVSAVKSEDVKRRRILIEIARIIKTSREAEARS
ncbi:signal recognition particle [Thermocladium modestius]|uniref:Signal recognition particle 19 kDa protein n=2 Tax=Thermocladium modestius TaxID=62609 RepID=A0A830GUZ1_9CREN|nr:signal recognition particle [Thermocladium modestius]